MSDLLPSLCSAYAPSNIFVLLSWSCGLYTVCVKHNSQFSASNSWRVLIGSMALLLDMITESTKAKPSVKKGALVRTRRALRSVSVSGFPSKVQPVFLRLLTSKDGAKIPEVISTLLTLLKTNQTPLRLAMLIGVAVSVLIRLKNVTEEPVKRLPQDLKVCSPLF